MYMPTLGGRDNGIADVTDQYDDRGVVTYHQLLKEAERKKKIAHLTVPAVT